MTRITFYLAFLFLISATAFSQQSDRKIKKEVKDRAIREARKEARKLKKEGWYVNPGSMPLDKVLENAWIKQYTEDDDGQPLYITADGNGVAESKSAAEMQAIELAKLQLAGLIETNMNSLISANIANAQLSTSDAATVTEVVQSSKNVIAMQLGKVDPFFKILKDLDGDKIEVQVRLFYDRTQSMEIAKKIVKDEIKQKLQLNEQKLEQLMGIN